MYIYFFKENMFFFSKYQICFKTKELEKKMQVYSRACHQVMMSFSIKFAHVVTHCVLLARCASKAATFHSSERKYGPSGVGSNLPRAAQTYKWVRDKLSDSCDLTLPRLSWSASEAVCVDSSMRICRQKSI